MTCLVTGGAGYIGSHIIASLTAHGYRSVVVDDLSTGVEARIAGLPLLVADISDPASIETLTAFMRDHGVTSIIHTAAHKSVPESMVNPLGYYRVNVGGTINVLRAAEAAQVSAFVFSGTAAVYGMADGRVTEQSPTTPINPYGESKLAGEQLLADLGRIGALRATSLRYFNVAGTGSTLGADNGATNLIPQALRRISQGVSPEIYGSDYPTPDGTCVRDYIHVVDLAEAHIAALAAIEADPTWSFRVFNVGTGTGYSVREVLDLAIEVSETSLGYRLVDRRPGDPASIVADPQRITHELGWSASHNLRDMVSSAWNGMTGTA